jgi:hypothetical protein
VGELVPGLSVLTEITPRTTEVGFPWLAELGADGKVYVVTDALTGGVAIADSSATHIGSLAQIGDGPGELRHPSFVTRRGSSLVVAQGGRRSAAVFASDGRYVGELQSVEVALDGAVFIRGDSAIVPKMVMDETRFGLPLQLVGPEGRILRSFGAEDRTTDPRNPMAGARVLTKASDSSVWVGNYVDERLELWTSAGLLARTLHVERPWLIRERMAERGPIYRVRPQPVLQSIYCCVDNALYVIYQRPRADWRASPDTSTRERSVMEATEYLQYIEQVVLVVDAVSGAVRAEILGDSVALGGFLADGRLYGFRADPDGRQLLTFLKVVGPT